MPQAPAASAPEKGYTEEFRQQMDELFKDKTPPQPESVPPQEAPAPATESNESTAPHDTPPQ
ncbi:MAG: hypothetical protein LRY76_07780 [Alphaproteobacteria bacterium]|nr:hypothetical protein [Alphaproteobacteria bacterium]